MFKRQYFFILFVLKICTGGIANYIIMKSKTMLYSDLVPVFKTPNTFSTKSLHAFPEKDRT